MSHFQKIYDIVRMIPRGKVSTYGRVAQKLKIHPRVVGMALNKNPTPIVIPCHRVVGFNGHLRGYAGGIEKKRQLLLKEGVKFRNRMYVDLNSSLWLPKS